MHKRRVDHITADPPLQSARFDAVGLRSPERAGSHWREWQRPRERRQRDFLHKRLAHIGERVRADARGQLGRRESCPSDLWIAHGAKLRWASSMAHKIRMNKR